MEAIAEANGDGPRFYQLYWGKSDDLAESFVKRAEAIGCRAIFITLDTLVLGWRPRDLDLGFSPFLRGQGIAQAALQVVADNHPAHAVYSQLGFNRELYRYHYLYGPLPA